jgi:dynein heavy chain
MGLNEISWVINNLGAWFTGLQERYNQLNNWLRDGRPNIFILGFFFNPTGFLTAVKQEITR